jgi:hypothetical protein
VVSSVASSSHENFDVETLHSGTGSPHFDFAEFFSGHTRASGWFSDRFGRPRRHFCGDFFGAESDSGFVLDEKLYYTDGVSEARIWEVQVSDSGVFTAQSQSLINDAHGFIEGNVLRMSYSMRVKIEENRFWDLDMKDVMILQPDGSLHNIVQVYKWGIRIGSVATQYQHHDGSECCASLISQLSSSGGRRHLSSVP